jgi:hypothetical protein
MKKIFMFILIVFLCTQTSCIKFWLIGRQVDSELHDFAIDLIKNPDKILDLKKHYPNYYNDSLIYNSMNDSIHIEEKYSFIKYHLTPNIKKCDIFEVDSDDYTLIPFIEHGYKYELSSKNTYRFVVLYDNHCAEFTFIIKDNHYYLFIITTGYFS